ncbi:Uncharacterised protein [Kluyvera intermedia]|nr:Uncharacterised protein [Kluyvera intermedia]
MKKTAFRVCTLSGMIALALSAQGYAQESTMVVTASGEGE